MATSSKIKKQILLNSFDNPPVIDETLISCVAKIANAYCRNRWNTRIPETTIKVVLQSLAMYRQLLNVGENSLNKEKE